MSDAIKYDSLELAPYLLGAAPEEETERYDELSVTDDSFAEMLAAAEKDLFDAYVLGELTTADRAAFERRYLNSPHGRAKAAFAEMFQEFASWNGDADTPFTVPLIKEGKTRGWFGLDGNLLQWGFAVAVLLLALIVGGIFINSSWLRGGGTDSAAANNGSEVNAPAEPKGLQAQNNPAPEMQGDNSNKNGSPELAVADPVVTTHNDNSPSGKTVANVRRNIQPPLALSLVLTPQLRSGGQTPTLSIPPNAARVAARLHLEPNDFHNFHITLSDGATGRVVWRSGNVRAVKSSDKQVVTATIRTDILKLGNYSFSVSGIYPNGRLENIGDYTFKVMR